MLEVSGIIDKVLQDCAGWRLMVAVAVSERMFDKEVVGMGVQNRANNESVSDRIGVRSSKVAYKYSRPDLCRFSSARGKWETETTWGLNRARERKKGENVVWVQGVRSVSVCRSICKDN